MVATVAMAQQEMLLDDPPLLVVLPRPGVGLVEAQAGPVALPHAAAGAGAPAAAVQVSRAVVGEAPGAQDSLRVGYGGCIVVIVVSLFLFRDGWGWCGRDGGEGEVVVAVDAGFGVAGDAAAEGARVHSCLCC